MSFIDTIRRTRELLEREGRISFRVLKREFSLDDEALEELVEQLVDIQQVAAREGKALAWIGGAAQATEQETVATVSERESAPEAERRRLTVLFCDLVGSTSLASQMDPEDWRELVRGYQETAAEVIERFGGHVAQYLGDGLLVYFGWPRAHEDDAERAMRVGLGIVDAIAIRDSQLSVRIGIHTGSVVVGEMGRGVSRETLAMGDTTNLAARLQGIAEPGQVVVSGATLRLVQGLFLAEDLGSRELKGFADPIRTYRVVRTTGVQSRLDVAAATGLTPLVGREQELGLLDDRWAQVKEGMGQAVLISGEAGIGKSRLVAAFRQHLASEPHTWLECRCSPYTQDSALFPVTDLLRQALSLVAGEDLQSHPEQLERALEWVGFELDETVPLMASFLSIPLPEGYSPLTLSPEGQRKKTLALLAEWLLRLGRQQPVVLLFEDLHWVDPSTQELLGTILEQVPTASVLGLYTYRPDFEVPWAPRSEVTPLLLPRLTRAQASKMIERIAAATSLTETGVQQIVQRSDGVPLFIEEITRTALESERRASAGIELPTLQIPETLQDSLMARLDALGPVKELAQVGAVLGREFSYELVLAVTPLKPEELQQALGAAVREELFYQRGTPPEATYLFKHALIQDAAYQSLLRSTRQRYHRRVAETLRERMPKLAEEQPELLARHLSEAGDVEPALEWWQRAGERALERSANNEAARHFRRGLELIETLAEPETRERLELPLRSGLGSALWALTDWNEAENTYRRSLELAEHLRDDGRRAMALYGVSVCLFTQSRLDESLELGQALRRHTEATGDLEGELAAWSVLIGVPLLKGQFSSALEALGGFMERDKLLKDDASWRRFGASQRIQPRCWGAWSLWLAGHRDQAIALFDETLALARRTEHPITLCFALGLRGPTLVSEGLAPELDRDCRELIAVADEQDAPLWLGLGRLFQTWALVAQGEGEHADDSQPALALAGSTGNLGGAPALVCCHAETLRLASDIPAALQAVDLALTASEQLGQHFYDAELHRMKAELLRVEGEAAPEDLECELLRAVEIAQSQGAKSLEVRAATSLARLWQSQGKHTEARDLLRPVYDWFTEGFDTQDLKDAKALLDELA